MPLPLVLTESESDPSSDVFMKLQWTPWRDIDGTEGLPKTRAYYRIRRKGEDIPFSIGSSEQMINWHFGEMLARERRVTRKTLLLEESAYINGCREDGIGLEYSISPVPNGYDPEDVRTMRTVAVLMHQAYRVFCGRSPEFTYNRHHTSAVPPMEPQGKIGEREWMGLEWEEPIPFEQRMAIPGRKGFHIVFRDGRPYHIGWEADMNTGNSWKRVARFGDSVSASYIYHSKDAAEQMLTDMLACYIIEYGRAPDGQFRIGNGSNQLM